MSNDRHGDDEHRPDDLPTDLRAFGLTLEHLTGQSIRPVSPTPSEGCTESDARTGPTSRANRVVWLAAAALLLVAAGFGLGQTWPAGDDSINSTNSPDADSDGADSGRAESTDEEGRSTQERDGAVAQTTVTSAPALPSAITAADGALLSLIDNLGPLTDEPAPALRHHGDVIARGVLAELVHLEVFGPVGRAEVADRLATDGLTVTTTFDQGTAELARLAIIALHPDGDRPDEVAVLTIDNQTGAVVATANSGSPTSVLFDGLRQPGSAFKPMVLATLFGQGHHPDDLVDADGPCRFTPPDTQGAEPYVVGGTTRGTLSLRAVTLISNNCAFVRLGQAAGLDQVLGTARDLGVTTLSDDADGLLSLPLGVEPINGIELAGAYAAMANGGVQRAPWLITEVLDRDGDVLYRRNASADGGRAAITAETAALLTSVLESNVLSGTGRRAQLGGGHRAAGKTGTTEGAVDAWFVGFTSRYTTVVWVGDPDDTTTRIMIPGWSGFGGGLPAAVWGHYNEELHRQIEPEPFPEASPLDSREPVTLVADHDGNGGYSNGPG